MPNIAVSAILMDAVDDRLYGVNLVRPHYQQHLFAGDEDHVAADGLGERAFCEERIQRNGRGR